jgi:uncharacterized protein YbjT (DUF2867 family)
MKVIVTGVTGTAGSEALRQALEDPAIEKVFAISRRPIDVAHPKLEIIVHEDFMDYSAILPKLEGARACLWCLGVSQNDVNAETYVKITYDYALAAAKAFAQLHPDFMFCFLSGSGADSRENSRILFARVKGRTENALSALGKPNAIHFRPGYIHPVHTKPKKWFERALEPMTPLFYRFLPGMIISTVELAQAMLHVAKHGATSAILENSDIRALLIARPELGER